MLKPSLNAECRMLDAMKIAFFASPAPQAQESLRELQALYGTTSPEEADIFVALGGDGHVLKTLHAARDSGKPVYALRRTQAVGFLCNDYNPTGLMERLAHAQHVELHPLKLSCKKTDGRLETSIAINEVAFLRDSLQSAKLRVCVDGVERLHCYSGDGLLVSTPAGSTAYNHSAGGPIMPLSAGTLVMTAICGFRPRRWSYAILPQTAMIDIEVTEIEKRPVRIESGFDTIRDVAAAHIELDKETRFTLLFDPDQHLGERLIREQFMT